MRHDYSVSRGREAYGSWPVELPVAGSRLAELEVERAVACVEYLDAVVASIGHCDPIAGGEVGRRHGLVELPVSGALPAELEGEGAVGVEDLDAVVEGISHRDSVSRGRKYGRHRIPKLPVASS